MPLWWYGHTWKHQVHGDVGLSNYAFAGVVSLINRLGFTKFSYYFAERGFVNPSCRPCPGVIDNVGGLHIMIPNLKAKHHRCISKNSFLLVVCFFCASENAALLSCVVIPFDFLTL